MAHDALLGAATLAVASLLIAFAGLRRDRPLGGVPVKLGLLLAAVATGHVLGVVGALAPAVPALGAAKLAAALVACTAALALVPELRPLLALRGPEEWEREAAGRRRLEEELARSREEMERRVRERMAALEALMEAVPASVWIAHDPDCRKVTGNRAGYEMLRLDSGRNASLTAPDGERPSHFRFLREGVELPIESLPVQRAARGVEVQGFEEDIVFDDGTCRRLFGNATPLFDAGGRPRGAVAAFVDITDRVRAEAELRASERRFRELADAMPQIVWSARPDGYLDYYNRRWYEFTGLPPGRGGDPSWEPIVHPDDVEPCRENWYRSVRSGEPFEGEYRFLDQRTGGYRWHLGRALPVRDESGAIVRWYGTSTDIDELKQAQDALRASEARLALALEVSHLGLWEWDPAEETFRSSNRLDELFGFAPGEFDGRAESLRRRIHPEDLARVEGVSSATRETGERAHWEYRVVWPDGTVRWLEGVGGAVAMEGGRPSRLTGVLMDVTSRKLAEEELRRARDELERRVRERTLELEAANRSLQEKERLFRAVFDQTFQFVGLLDPEGRVVEANRTALDFAGVDRADVVGRPIWETRWWDRSPESRRRIRSAVAAAAAGELVRYEVEVRGANDRVATLDFSLKPLRDDDGRVVLLIPEGRDITERIRAEALLRQQSELLELAHDAIIVRDLDGRIRYWSTGAAATYGWAAEEAVGRSTHELLRTRWPRRLEQIEAVVLGAGRWEGELVHDRRDGTPIIVESRWAAIRDAGGEVATILEINREITERKRAEEALRWQSGLMTAILDDMGDGVIVADEVGTILVFNPAAEAILGVGRLDVPPAEWPARFGLFLPDMATPYPPDQVPLARAIRGESIDGIEVFVRNPARPDGVWTSSNVRPLLAVGGGHRGGVAVFRDTTERKRTEQELARQAEELARSNAELERFAYVASHDLQEPLRMVSSFTQLLAKRYGGQLDARADEYIAFAVDGCVRMQRLIEGLLDYSRVNTRGQPFVLVDCEALLSLTLSDLRVAVEESGALVTHDPLPTLVADPTQLGRLFQNLVANAIKFRSDRPPRVHVSAGRSDDAWTFRVADNGIGIAPEHAGRVFQLFQRLHGRDEYPGTGIGLALCQRIVERHGGRIWYEPNPGGGTRFLFTIPRRPVP